MQLHIFRTVWYGANILLVLSMLVPGYEAAWEYATQCYLKEFSDAIVPPMTSGEEEIEAILNRVPE